MFTLIAFSILSISLGVWKEFAIFCYLHPILFCHSYNTQHVSWVRVRVSMLLPTPLKVFFFVVVVAVFKPVNCSRKTVNV